MIVNGTMVTATGGTPDTATVTISLVDQQGRFTSGFIAGTDREVVGLARITVDKTGAWTADLTPTGDITSTAGATLYRVDERVTLGASATYYISVPSSGGPYWVGDIRVPLPGTPDQPALYLPLAGGQMTGPLLLSHDPLVDSEAATKAYVDASGGGGGGGTPSGTVVSETTYGQSAVAGAATAYSRGDHTHGSPALSSSAASASAVGDAATAGAATTPARSDHKHGREAFGAVTAQTSYGAASGNGSAATLARSDHTHGTPSLTSSAASSSVPGDSAAAGAATTPARADHVHGRESIGTGPGTIAAGDDARITGALQAANNLSDVGSAATARTNLAVPPTSRLISAGTGLTGGGSLAADRTLAVAYGTSAGTATEGNDSRVNGAVQKSTLTAKGSIYVATGAGTVVELPVGSNDQVLTADSTQSAGAKWATPSGGGGGMDQIFPLAGHGLLAASGNPEAFNISSGYGSGVFIGRVWIPAGVAITAVWLAVAAGGTYGSGSPNQLGVWADAGGAPIKTTADDNTLLAAAGWRGGNLSGGAIASQGSGRFVYIGVVASSWSGVSLPYAPAGSNSSWLNGVPGGGTSNRRAMFAFDSTLPGALDPTSYGATSFLPLFGAT